MSVVFLLLEDDDILQIKGCSSPVQRDFDILLRLHRLLVFTFCTRGHDLVFSKLTEFLQKG